MGSLAMKFSEIIARVCPGVFTHSGPEAAIPHCACPSFKLAGLRYDLFSIDIFSIRCIQIILPRVVKVVAIAAELTTFWRDLHERETIPVHC